MAKPRGIGAVVIGRNEGARLVRCLASMAGQVERIVYVDSGSTDGSIQAAQAAGAETISLDLSQPFTAARARNAGWQAMLARHDVAFIQFVDGDCEVQPGWLAAAGRFLDETPTAAIVSGRLRERFPEASIYNAICDAEWDTPIGKARACGGNAMIRAACLIETGGFNPTLIAGEEPELCVRLRRAGWEIWRIDAEMALHDAAMTWFGQWWTRTRRAGHAYAEGASLHGAPPERHYVAERRRALIWGAALPALAILLGVVHPLGWSLLLAYPLQVLRLAKRGGIGSKAAWRSAFFTTLGKVPEVLGVIGFVLARLRRKPASLIEYR